jgi:hypothetical protein
MVPAADELAALRAPTRRCGAAEHARAAARLQAEDEEKDTEEAAEKAEGSDEEAAAAENDDDVDALGYRRGNGGFRGFGCG